MDCGRTGVFNLVESTYLMPNKKALHLHKVPVLEYPNESTSMGTVRLAPPRSIHVRCNFMLSAMAKTG